MEVNFLDYEKCNTTTYNDLLTSTIGTPVDSGNAGFKFMDVSISIDKENITDSALWSWTNATSADLSFCSRVDLVTDTAFTGLSGLTGPLKDVLEKSLGYAKVKYQLTIDMTNNFEVDIAVEETEEDSTDVGQTAKVEYTVEACQCTLNDKVCITGGETLSQNELLNVCVYPTQEDIVIRNVQSFQIEQGDLSVTFITPTATNPLTTVSVMNEKTISISTVLISAFFINPADVKAQGIVTLSFADTGRVRQLSSIGAVSEGRALQVGGAGEGSGTFDMTASLTPLGEEAANEYDNIDPSSALALNVYNGAVATFAMAAAIAGFM